MNKTISKDLNKKLNTNLSFAGCGFLGIYHVGVGVCFKKYASHLLIQKIAGASAGAIVACALLLDLQLDDIAAEFFKIVTDARSYSLGPFSPSFNIQQTLLDGIERKLPADAHDRVNGRLHISLTRIFDGKNVVVSRFNSREDLVDALACSFFIPGFSGLIPPKFHGVRYMDGAFSDNLITLDDNTVSVSPFSGETDISPKDNLNASKFHISLSNTSMEFSTKNIRRLLRSLIPPPPIELSNMCRQGFNDALDFLYQNDLISCHECSLIHMNYLTSNCETLEFGNECDKCSESRENLDCSSSMPEYVLEILSKHVEGPNSMMTKIFRTATLPIAIPCSIANYLLIKIPKASKVIYDFRRVLAENFHQLLISSINSLMAMARTYEEEMERSNEQLNRENIKNHGKYLRRSGNYK